MMDETWADRIHTAKEAREAGRRLRDDRSAYAMCNDCWQPCTPVLRPGFGPASECCRAPFTIFTSKE